MDPVTFKLAKNYTDEKSQESGIRVSTIGKELTTLKNTLASVNINQEAKQSVSGYEVVSLPKNAANMPMTAGLKGMLLKNELNYNPETWAEWTSGFRGSILNGDLIGTGITGGGGTVGYLGTNCKPNTKYLLLYYIKSNSLNVNGFRIATNSISGLLNLTHNVGNNKSVFTTPATISYNRLFLEFSSAVTSGEIISNSYRLYELPVGSQIETDAQTLTADELAIKYPYIQGGEYRGVKAAVRYRSVDSEGNNESTQYQIATSDGQIAELRQLPNGVVDDMERKRVSDEHILRGDNLVWDSFNSTDIELYYRARVVNFWVNKNAVLFSSINVALATSADGDYRPSLYVTNVERAIVHRSNDEHLYIKIEKSKIDAMPSGGTIAGFREYLNLYPITLYYQLAQEQPYDLQTSGLLLSNPSGTVHAEKCVPDAGIYSNGLSVLYPELKIKEIESISKINFTTGVETELDVSLTVIAGDKLSFTHPDLTDGDIVSFVYFYEDANPNGEVVGEYYDSRYVIADSANGKFYQWEIGSTNGVASINLVEV